MPNISMNKLWDTPKEHKQLVKLLGFAAGSIEEAETTPEMEKAYKDVAAMCAFYIREYERKRLNK